MGLSMEEFKSGAAGPMDCYRIVRLSEKRSPRPQRPDKEICRDFGNHFVIEFEKAAMDAREGSHETGREG